MNDPQTIAEKIATEFATHNADDSAHGQSAEAIYNHRIAEILDHLDGSISLNKLVDQKNVLVSSFESLDLWQTKSGYSGSTILGLLLQTGNVSGVAAFLTADVSNWSTVADPARNPFFQTTIAISSNSDCFGYIILGTINFDGTDSQVGFKFVNGSLYALITNTDGESQTEHTHLISDVDITLPHTYKCVVNNTDQEVYFYIDGVLVYTETTYFPDSGSPGFAAYYIKNTAASNKFLNASYLYFQSDK